jgi:ATP-dependent RNA helicase DOB1
VTGKPLPLLSKFKLSYYTLLNILRRAEGSGQDMEFVIARSFQQFQFERSLPEVRMLPPAGAPDMLPKLVTWKS